MVSAEKGQDHWIFVITVEWISLAQALRVKAMTIVANNSGLGLIGLPFEIDLLAITSAKIMELNQRLPHIKNWRPEHFKV